MFRKLFCIGGLTLLAMQQTGPALSPHEVAALARATAGACLWRAEACLAELAPQQHRIAAGPSRASVRRLPADAAERQDLARLGAGRVMAGR